MKIGFVHRWCDLWVGAYYDRKALRLYVLPFPTLGFWVERSRPPQFASPEELFGPVPPGMVDSDPDLSLRQRMRGRRVDMRPTLRSLAERFGITEEDALAIMQSYMTRNGDDGEAMRH